MNNYTVTTPLIFKPLKYLALSCSVTISLAGCATIFEGGTQPVTITSTPDQANVVISNKSGEKIHSGLTPATVTLKRGAGYFESEQYSVEISKSGFQTMTIAITGSINGWYVGNILFGGLIGLLIVDPLTGAMYDLAPDKVEAVLSSSGVSYQPGDRALTVMLAQDVPSDLQQYTRSINAY